MVGRGNTDMELVSKSYCVDVEILEKDIAKELKKWEKILLNTIKMLMMFFILLGKKILKFQNI